MPDFIRDWNDWWLDFWTDHPVLFWTALVAGVCLVLISQRLSRR
ncbi:MULTISPECIES: hypothetical protein [unclassified Mesorhizobium]|nr:MULTISPECIES: hypothetical protein [unclassified Mesorhizobium]